MTPTPEKSKKDEDAQREREDEVLRRLLKTPPKPHKDDSKPSATRRPKSK